MYTFGPTTERVRHTRELIRNRVTQIDSEKARIITEANKKYGLVPPIIRRPLYAKAIAEQMTIRIEDFEIIVGNKGKAYTGSSMSPEWFGANFMSRMVQFGGWSLREDGMYHNPDDDDQHVCMAVEDFEYFESVRDYWQGKTLSDLGDAFKPDCLDELRRLQCDDYGGPQAAILMIPAGHLTPGFQHIINQGYGAIKKQADDWLAEHYGNIMGAEMDKYMFYKGASIVCEAAEIMVGRYAAKAAEMAAAETEPKRRAELEMMADSMKWITDKPARTFYEACQTAMFYQLFLALAGGYPASAFGRFDQYTWPFLKKDLEEGRITPEYAQEIVDSFFLKANAFYGGMAGKGVNTQGIGNTYQHTTIGGVLPATGEDATNPVTYMVLETVGRLLLHDPTISLRINPNTPDKLWDCAIETSKLVGGLPLFQNDEVIIPGLVKTLGFSIEDARDYSLIGCQEIVGSGTDYPAGNGLNAPHASIHYSVVFDMAMNDGCNPFNKQQAGLHTGFLYDMTDIGQVRAAFENMARYVMRMHITMHNYTQYLTEYNCPHPDLSIGIEGCMEKGRDCTVGGAKYTSFGGTATGLATVADSITTIKYMCFDKKLCTTRELYDAYMNDWEGQETLRQYIINNVPHYGNGDPYADDELKWVVDTYYKLCSEMSGKIFKAYKAGMYGAADHIVQGYTTWATPDGRRTGTPIADAMSPAQGRDTNGPTAVLNSTCCFDHTRFMDGMAVNLRIHPAAVNTEEAKASLREMTRSFFEEGGMEVQYNIVSSETLKKAQANPDEYKDLVVRIAGYSAYFVELARDLQNDLITRTENQLG